MSDPTQLAQWVRDARERSLGLVADLSPEQLKGPRLAIVNPLHWEIGHVAWFQELWALRQGRGERPLREDGDSLWDSGAVPHDTRWDLRLPSIEETKAYMREVRDRVVDGLAVDPKNRDLHYLVLYSVFHEDMHDEAFTYTRQTLGYPSPPTAGSAPSHLAAGPLAGDAEVPGGTFALGAAPDETFVFDNEKWAHPVGVAPFAIARAPVTQEQFAAFVDGAGYARRELWSEAGWEWRIRVEAEHPVYWRHDASGWQRRDFDRWVPLEPHRPIIHVSWHEAEAYCAWAGRRLPTEAEWEAAASLAPGAGGRGLSPRKRRFPWGDDAPTSEHANLDARAGGCADVAALPAGDSAFGCRQMIGNVWEWVADDFRPYPGFVPDMYRDYSQPWFGTHKVLRGGCWVTRARLLRNTWRNFYPPDRRDVWAGFRTCRL
ncbi:MAG: ergothioneine biosynthesis protein EgtB [Acidobacteria bacterium]|nr:MAG: ergothioneine biosynthesis protein EgtB [Acidobacteriota bacterium]